MKLRYRGVQYKEVNRDYSDLTTVPKKPHIVYRGNSVKPRFSPKFPWWQYVKQLFDRSESRPIFDPISFWYDRKREFIEYCWFSRDIEQLDRAWQQTLQIERAKIQSQQKTKLKYRGVTYYR